MQTPQAFRASVLRAAHRSGSEATDDAALVELCGGRVVVVAGEPDNRKITHLERSRVGARAGVSKEATMTDVRVGQGFDIHRFSDDPQRRLVLGGVVFDGSRGLHGHSDADAVAHAVADALLGAAGLGDIGEHFPDTDARWKDADSLVLLAHAGTLVRADGWTIGNVDCSVVCERRSWRRTGQRCRPSLSDSMRSTGHRQGPPRRRVSARSGVEKVLPAGRSP